MCVCVRVGGGGTLLVNTNATAIHGAVEHRCSEERCHRYKPGFRCCKWWSMMLPVAVGSATIGDRRAVVRPALV